MRRVLILVLLVLLGTPAMGRDGDKTNSAAASPAGSESTTQKKSLRDNPAKWSRTWSRKFDRAVRKHEKAEALCGCEIGHPKVDGFPNPADFTDKRTRKAVKAYIDAWSDFNNFQNAE